MISFSDGLYFVFSNQNSSSIGLVTQIAPIYLKFGAVKYFYLNWPGDGDFCKTEEQNLPHF